MSWTHKLKPAETKKLLALDGGGTRSLITIEVLAEVEKLLQDRLNNPNLVLADYFDYVAGTGTGGILATLISLGYRTDEIREIFLGPFIEVFKKSGVFKRFLYKYDNENLGRLLRDIIGGDEITLSSEKLQTLLMMVLRNATTDSLYPVSNNPRARYNDADRVDSNLKLPLWRLVRATNASPTYFAPEVIRLHDKEFVFVSGNITVYNNPAFLLFLMATIPPYRLEWPRGDDRLQLISIGTGVVPQKDMELSPDTMNLIYNASAVPSALMLSTVVEQDILCRLHGKCVHGGMLDRELGDLSGAYLSKSFLYARYNVELSYEGLASLGIHDMDPTKIQTGDSFEHADQLLRVGAAVAAGVHAEHFAGFLNSSIGSHTQK
jgi:Patatin-like phospholipase